MLVQSCLICLNEGRNAPPITTSMIPIPEVLSCLVTEYMFSKKNMSMNYRDSQVVQTHTTAIFFSCITSTLDIKCIEICVNNWLIL